MTVFTSNPVCERLPLIAPTWLDFCPPIFFHYQLVPLRLAICLVLAQASDGFNFSLISVGALSLSFKLFVFLLNRGSFIGRVDRKPITSFVIS